MKKFLLFGASIIFVLVLSAWSMPSSHHHKHPQPTPTITPKPTNTPTSTPTIIPISGTSFQYQLTGSVVLNGASWYDIDGFDNSASTVASIHAAGAKAICYVDGGTWENWRSDASQFPSSVQGAGNGWPGEKWLDIRQISALLPIMTARTDICKSKGFDAIEWDNVDGYTNSTGFPLTSGQQLVYNKALADIAHKDNLLAIQKNDLEQADQLVSSFDALLLEQCEQYGECSSAQPYIDVNKPVWDVEYSGTCKPFSGIVVIHKHLALDSRIQAC